jgi:peptide/nickel transport system ATP-binding protein
MPEESSPLLKINNLAVTFNSHEGRAIAVDNLNLTLNQGETLGIVGESGSGKSVTSLAIMGLIPNPPGEITGGEVIFGNQDLLKISDKELRAIRGNDISMIFQEPMTSLNPILTCGFQIAETLRLHKKLSKQQAKQVAVELLDQVGIPSPEKAVKRFPHQLSGGMRQRVMIAMALACRPKILIADEPTTALDVTIQAQILDLMKDLSKSNDTAIIMITHDLGVVADIADTVMVMYTGHGVEYASKKELFGNPLHPYTQGLIRTIPKITRERQRLDEIKGVVLSPTEERTGCTFHSRCSVVMDKCKSKAPNLTEHQPGHFVRCWRYED